MVTCNVKQEQLIIDIQLLKAPSIKKCITNKFSQNDEQLK